MLFSVLLTCGHWQETSSRSEIEEKNRLAGVSEIYVTSEVDRWAPVESHEERPRSSRRCGSLIRPIRSPHLTAVRLVCGCFFSPSAAPPGSKSPEDGQKALSGYTPIIPLPQSCPPNARSSRNFLWRSRRRTSMFSIRTWRRV